MKQRDNRWRRARLGDVTASCYHAVLTAPSPKGVFAVEGERGSWYVARHGEAVSGHYIRKVDAEERKAELVVDWRQTHWSQTAESYLDAKLSELIHCQPADVWRSDATDWGTENEPNAFQAAIPVIEKTFGEKLSLPVDDFAYVHHPTEPYIGCSPDGLIGDDATCEIKCPYNGANWIAAKRHGLTLPSDYVPQVQGQLWVCERQWCAFCYFDPRVAASGLDPLLWIKVERDNDYIDNVLAPRVTAFRDYLRAEYKRLIGGKEPF